MVDEARSLNLSNAVAIIAYEAMRQLDYPDLKAEGNWIQPKQIYFTIEIYTINMC